RVFHGNTADRTASVIDRGYEQKGADHYQAMLEQSGFQVYKVFAGRYPQVTVGKEPGPVSRGPGPLPGSANLHHHFPDRFTLAKIIDRLRRIAQWIHLRHQRFQFAFGKPAKQLLEVRRVILRLALGEGAPEYAEHRRAFEQRQ